MNKYLKALNLIDSYLPKDVRNVREAVILLRGLADKETPELIRHYDLYKCKNCGNLYGNCEIESYTYCRVCGKRLKWINIKRH